MTTTVRRGAFLGLTVLLLTFTTLAGVSFAQDGEECYPVPPGGCETEITCEDIIAAIEEGTSAEDSPGLDTNGDGTIDAGDLPSVCTCDEIESAIDDGRLPETALPEDCVEIETQQDQPSEEPEPEVLADTGIAAGPLALLALVGLGGGALAVGAARRRA
ncbi:hypothetical protein [Euzebya sp.]|uniref:hypothetical protein n=1 Tax=Euzebya sp. TaxID=1971409 RepID=UPI003512FDE5